MKFQEKRSRDLYGIDNAISRREITFMICSARKTIQTKTRSPSSFQQTFSRIDTCKI